VLIRVLNSEGSLYFPKNKLTRTAPPQIFIYIGGGAFAGFHIAVSLNTVLKSVQKLLAMAHKKREQV